MNLSVKSSDCDELNIKTKFFLNSRDIKKCQVIYSFFFSIIFLAVKFYTLLDFDRRIQNTPSMALNTSLITILVFSTMELIFGLEQLV